MPTLSIDLSSSSRYSVQRQVPPPTRISVRRSGSRNRYGTLHNHIWRQNQLGAKPESFEIHLVFRAWDTAATWRLLLGPLRLPQESTGSHVASGVMVHMGSFKAFPYHRLGSMCSYAIQLQGASLPPVQHPRFVLPQGLDPLLLLGPTIKSRLGVFLLIPVPGPWMSFLFGVLSLFPCGSDPSRGRSSRYEPPTIFRIVGPFEDGQLIMIMVCTGGGGRGPRTIRL